MNLILKKWELIISKTFEFQIFKTSKNIHGLNPK